MQAFKYRGIAGGGEKIEGEITANTIDEAEHRVLSQDVTIISIVPVGLRVRSEGGSSGGATARKKGGKMKEADVAAILRDLSVMSETGVPFVEALDAVIATTVNERALEGLRQLRSEVVGGKSLSVGMRAANDIFPNIVCEMVRVAEEGGRLEKALMSAAVYLERGADLRRRVMNAMLYPIVLTVIAVLAIGVLVTFVLPKFSTIFKSMGAEVPATTRAILNAGEYVRGHPIWVLAGLAVFAFCLRAVFKAPAAKRWFTTVLLRVPMLGDLMRKLALSRAFQSISTLLACNVSLMSALEHGAKVSGNPVIEEALTDVRSGVEHGGSLSDCLAAAGVFTPMLIQMVAIGERTGRLPSLMATTSQHLEDEVDARIKALVSIVEPVMLAVMGCVVGFITISIITPIYSVVQNIK